MKIALLQIRSTSDKKENLRQALAWADRAVAAGAKWIVYPEVCVYRGPALTEETYDAVAETIPGATTQVFQRFAKDYAVSVVVGSLYEKSLEAPRAYNTSVAIDATGTVVGVYRKRNLFVYVGDEQTIDEQKSFCAGENSCMVNLDGFQLGLSICFDLRFPELYRSYAKQGANVLLVPSSFTKQTGQEHWHALLRARAIENLAYVVAPNQVGLDERGITAFGHSIVVDPWGKVVAEGSADKEEVVLADIDLGYIQQVRKKLPNIFGDVSKWEE